MKPTKRKKLKPIGRLIKEASSLAQLWARLDRADKYGNCKCVTCGIAGHYKTMQGGHFIERGKAATRLFHENIHPQCPGCNLYGMKKASTVLAYRRYLVGLYGDPFITALELTARQTKKWNRQQLEDYITIKKLLCKNKRDWIESVI